jgi:hypothetical protein
MSKLKAIVLAAALAAVGGCASGIDPWLAQNGMLSKADMQSKGDALISEGTKLKNDAAGMKAGEWKMLRTKEQMISDGDQMIKDGQAMKSKAASL